MQGVRLIQKGSMQLVSLLELAATLYICRRAVGGNTSGSVVFPRTRGSTVHNNYYGLSIIYKEELKTVVRELLACTQSNRHETSTALRNPYRRVSLRGRRAKIRFSRGARGEKPANNRPPFWFYGESIRTFFTGRYSSGSSPTAGCLCS